MNRNFRNASRQAIEDQRLHRALNSYSERKKHTFKDAFDPLADPASLRQRARAIREHTLANLDDYLATFSENIAANGFTVHRAKDAHAANQIVLDIIRRARAKHVVKSKTMVSEEIHLNAALQAAGIEVLETDLGEFIVQLRNEPPSHIVAPAIHLSREDVARTFADKLGMSFTTDVEAMNDTARQVLRRKFLAADIGISGVNFGVAETGTLCVITNEGNGRMVTTLPRIHIALMGVERLVPQLEDLAPMLALLPRSATGQKITTYVHLMQSPRRSGDLDGPDERHLILVDNGRSALADSWLSEALYCIRCGACSDSCPVYREVGGHSYGSVYSGPIGSIVSTGLFGLESYGHLAKASSLCGACKEVCPVGIDIPSLLLRVRSDYARLNPRPAAWRFGLRIYAWLSTRPSRFRFAQKLGAWGTRLMPSRRGWIRRLPPPASTWTDSRDFPRFARQPFRDRFAELDQRVEGLPKSKRQNTPAEIEASPRTDLINRFSEELGLLEGTFIRCGSDQVGEVISRKLVELGADSLLVREDDPDLAPMIALLRERGVETLHPILKDGIDRKAQLEAMGHVDFGLTSASAGIAETGTLAITTADSQIASLLPKTHLALLRSDRIYANLEDWLADEAKRALGKSQSIALVSGPSRTSDIEMTLTLGVHGPSRVIVFCVG